MDWITLLDQWLSDPEDEVQLKEWSSNAEELAYPYEFSKKEQPYIDHIIELSIIQLRRRIHNAPPPSTVSQETIDALLSRKQTEQRTAAWYEQMATVISASELGKLFGSARQRAEFVLSKTTPPIPRFQPLATPSDYMTPFDWGIRFEPVVKQIYEYTHGVTIKELGRMHHQVDPRCTASPDGLISFCPAGIRKGRLLEIKCPVTREIDGTVPKDYYAQMQMQLHVTGLQQCDYVEAVFISRYNQMPLKEGPVLYSGFFAVIRFAEPVVGPSVLTDHAVPLKTVQSQDFYYAYSPVNATSEWTPDIKDGEEIIEITPWKLSQWSEQLIMRNEDWWKGMQPHFQAFWSDVEKAKQGEFQVPDSTRPSKKQKTEKCMIQFCKDDIVCNLITPFSRSASSPITVHKLDEVMTIDEVMMDA
jgi:putative phage-type endonuclease